MIRNQLILISCYVRFMKEWVKEYSEGVYTYELTNYSLSVYTKRNIISWRIMEKMAEISKNTSWEVRKDESGLIIKFWR